MDVDRTDSLTESYLETEKEEDHYDKQKKRK